MEEGSGGSNWRKNSGDSDFLKTSEFESEQFYSVPVGTRSNDYCPYSMRQNQSSLEYRYDILLVYDPEENTYYLDKLMEYLRPQNLEIFDFSRDAPPGLPQRKVLQSALKVCRYTCIVITKKFISNFWLQLRTDMSIQDMLDNEQKMYSVIVVVMDAAVKKADLPLDLATLSPLFFAEKFFENRIKLAFSKTTPFPSLQPSSTQQKDSVGSGQSLPENKYNKAPTVQFDNKLTATNPIMVHKKEMSIQPQSRQPCEHGDGTFVMPSSIFPSINPWTFDPTSAMHRTISVIVSSTGNREPQETSVASSHSSTECEKQNSVSVTATKNLVNEPSTTENHTFMSSGNLDNIFSPSCRSYKEDNFSFQSRPNAEQNRPESSALRDATEYEKPGFFSISDPSFINTNDSVLTDLEISADSVPVSINDTMPQSLPPRRESMNANHAEACNKNVKIDDDFLCTSLPAQLNTATSLDEEKKSRSMRSLVGSKFLWMSRSLSLRRKKK